jgi:taurine dioxygenase
MEIEPLSGAIGGIVRGVTLRSLEGAQIEAVREALHAYEMLAFPDQHLGDDEQLALGEKFGEIGVFPLAGIFGNPGKTITPIYDGPESPSQADGWHTDVTWMEKPPNYALLRADVVPERGGDTLWASLTAAFEGLSPTLQKLLRGLEVHHDCTTFLDAVRAKIGEEAFVASGVEPKLRAEHPGVDHPLVRTHPDTGREALFLGGDFMRHIVGMREVESAALLRLLREHLEDARYHVRWRWSPGDLVIWDERSTNHRSAGDHFPQERLVCRCEVGRDRPFYRPAA